MNLKKYIPFFDNQYLTKTRYNQLYNGIPILFMLFDRASFFCSRTNVSFPVKLDKSPVQLTDTSHIR